MNIRYAKIRLLDSESDLSYSQRISIADLLESLKCCGNCEYESTTDYYSNKEECRGDSCKDGDYYSWQPKASNDE